MTNYKLVILGFGVMLATALLFTAIGKIITRPVVTETHSLSPVSDFPEPYSETLVVSEPVAQPILQLTLPTRVTSPTLTLTSGTTPVSYPTTAVFTPDRTTPEPYPPPSVLTPDPYPAPDTLPVDTAIVEVTQTPTPQVTPVVGTSAIQGRILLRGIVLNDAVRINIENLDLFTVQQITFPGGVYAIYDLAPSVKGYSILFSQDINPGFSLDQVIRWGTVKASPVLTGEIINLSDLEIGLLGLQPVVPLPESVISTGPVSVLNPLRFEWAPYPSADQYWVELRSNRLSAPVWDSGFISATSVDFNGTLWSGAAIQPGTYWWSVGARLNERAMTISGPVWEFTLDW